MIKVRIVTILVAAISVLLMLLFPPYDYPSPQNNVPHFDGFVSLFDDRPNRVLNNSFLSIEILIVLIDAAIAWVLLSKPARPRHRLDRQNLVLLGVALILLLDLLFPPFQDYYTPTKALLPTFDSFYFIFGDNSKRVVVATMLWFEVIFVLATGTMLWLILRRPRPRELAPAERFAQSEEQLGTNTGRKP